MWLRLLYLYKSLTRNVIRTLLTCAAVALPIMIYVLSVSVIDGIERFLDNGAKQLRLAVTNKTSIVNPLPVGHRAKIESLDPTGQRLVSVCGVRWIGGKIENQPQPLSCLGVDPDTFVATFPEYGLTPEEIDNWNRDRRAIVVGRGTAGQFGWKVGDIVTIRASVPPYAAMEFRIISTGGEAADAITNWFRADYLEEVRKAQSGFADRVSFFYVKCRSKSDVDSFPAMIDELFANSLDETKTQDEKAFMNQFITQNFDLPRNLSILAAVTVFVAVMAAANTMSMNFRDRINEFATLKAMGFGGRTIFGLIQSESLFLCAFGGLIGAGLPYVLFTFTPLKDVPIPIIQFLEVRPIICVYALLISLGIGLLAAVWPSLLALRLKVVAALRNLE